MRVFIVLALVALASAGKVRVKGTYEKADFAAYKAKYNKSFSSAEESMRHENYLRTVAKINNHNAEYDQGQHTWFMGENNFMDWTQAEIENRNGFTGWNHKMTKTFVPTGKSSDAVDWRDQGAVNGVKDQGQCGSCWAFSTVASLEGQQAIVNGNLPDCSEQQLVDCDPKSSGCNGGLMTYAFDYIKGQGSNGLDTQDSYPYTARDGTCDTSKTQDGENVCATVSGYTELPQGDESALQDAVSSIGPISIAANASPWSSYSGGIFDSSSCDPNGLNHGIAMVGYDTAENFWIIRNSWGGSWGESGYMRMVMGKNMCGISNMSCYPNM
jgi:cathepsin L